MDAIVEQFSAVLWNVINRPSIVDLIDILLLTFIIYEMLVHLRHTRVSQTLKGIVVLLLALTGAQLTLPGVAGIILGIGMAVDANVVIFERIREEVKLGRPLGSAIRKGFSNALSAIVDANVTTIIAALVLYMFGTGSVRGFALTLLISVATSMFTAIFVTHKLLDVFADLGVKNQKLYVR